jgi:uncharacterized membrane protein YqjE
MANDRTPLPSAERAIESLPSLFTRLADQLTQLFEAKFALLRVELKEEVATYLRGAVMIVAGGMIALIGFALLNVAFAFLISMLFQSTQMSQPARYAAGFIITAALYLAIGGIVILKAKNRIAEQGIVPPRTASELARDKEWLNKQM